MAEENGREAQRRRRRLLQQGSDRLAFIKGHIQTLPPPDLQNQDASETNITHTPTFPEQQHTQTDEILSFPNSEIQPEPEPEPEHVQLLPQTLPDSFNEIPRQQTRAEEPRSFNFINPNDVSNAIDASKTIRLCCSIIVALLVVASYLGFSLIKTVISFRPLYLVLLTNSTFVVSKLISGKQRGVNERSRRRLNGTDSSDQWDGQQLAKTLEIGLVVKSVVDAVFMDCAVYAIVLICSLSFVHP